MISPGLSRRAAVAVNALQLAGRSDDADAIALASTDEELEAALALTAAAWDEEKHPREERGHREGGRFRGGRVEGTESRHHVGGGKRVGDLYVGDRFYLVYPEGPKLFEVVDTPSSSHSIVKEVDNPGAGYTHLESGVMTEDPTATPLTVPPDSLVPPEGAIEVTGRSLKTGSTFWGQKRGEWVKFEVVEGAGGTGRYIRIRDVATGQQAVMKASSKVTVNPADFPAAAKRAAKVAVSHVEGGYQQAFSQSPGKGTAVTKAANAASAEAGDLLAIPDGTLRPVQLKETKSISYGGTFQAGRKRGEPGYFPVSVSLRAGDETFEDMRDNFHHEMGHFIDYDGVDTELGKTASETRDPLVAGPVMDAIDNSAAVARINAMKSSVRGVGTANDYSIVYPDTRTGGERRVGTDYEHIRYLASPTEKFARAYEQWVGTKAAKGDAARTTRYRNGQSWPLDQKEFRSANHGSHHGFYGWYWGEDDFAPIESAFDEMFGRQGWLKN